MLFIEGIIIDKLKLYRGDNFEVKRGITIYQPTLNNICDYSEKEYFSMVHTLTANPADLKWQLDVVGIDYTKTSDFELFIKMLYQRYSQEETRILFGDLNLQDFIKCKKRDSEDVVLYNRKKDLIIDEYTYFVIVNVLREMHRLKRNDEIPGNETTKRVLIEDARDEYLINKDKEFQSVLKNMISTMKVHGLSNYNHYNIWDLPIYAFLDEVQRVQQVDMATVLKQSGYSGFGVSLDKIDKKNLNFFAEL